MQAVSPTTVRLTLTRSYSPEFYSTSELSALIPFPQQAWDKTSANGKVGNYDETHAPPAVAVFKYLPVRRVAEHLRLQPALAGRGRSLPAQVVLHPG